MLTVVHDAAQPNEDDAALGASLLDEIVRDGARKMLAAALQAEVAAYIEARWARKSPRVTEVLPLLYLRGRTTRARSRPGRWPTSTTSTCGSTGST